MKCASKKAVSSLNEFRGAQVFYVTLRALLPAFIVLATCSVQIAQAEAPVEAAPYILDKVPRAEAVGQGDLNYLIWDVYQATLFAPAKNFSYDKPFALELDYKHDVPRDGIIEATIKQMRLEGVDDEARLSTWEDQLKKIFVDAEDGSVLVGIYQPAKPTCFYKNGQPLGCMKDPAFGRAFFDIWLAPATSEPELRKSLLGFEPQPTS